jgi:hypothetical protein
MATPNNRIIIWPNTKVIGIKINSKY